MAKPKIERLSSEVLERTIRSLTEKELKFCENYALHGIASTAMFQAGYEDDLNDYGNSYSLRGQKMLEDEDVILYVSHCRYMHSVEAINNEASVLLGLKSIAFSSLDEKNRLKALELLGKNKSLFVDKVDHTTGGKKIKQSNPLTIHVQHRKKE